MLQIQAAPGERGSEYASITWEACLLSAMVSTSCCSSCSEMGGSTGAVSGRAAGWFRKYAVCFTGEAAQVL